MSNDNGMGERIKIVRKELDLTQQEFATRLGIKRNTIANYEAGRNQPIDAVCVLISQTFHVNPDWLRNGQGEMFIKTSPKAEVSQWLGGLFASEPEDFRLRFITELSKLGSEDWKKIEQFAQNITVTRGDDKKEG